MPAKPSTLSIAPADAPINNPDSVPARWVDRDSFDHVVRQRDDLAAALQRVADSFDKMNAVEAAEYVRVVLAKAGK